MSHSMQQPQYDPQQPYGAAPQGPPPPPQSYPARNGLGTAALTLGIIGTVSGLIPFLFWLAGILGLIALILGMSGRGRVKRGEAANKGVTTTGAILGLVALILSVVGMVITFKAVDDAVDEINKEVSGSSATKKPTPTPTPAASGKSDKPAAGGAAKSEPPKGEEPAVEGETLADGDTSIYDDDLEVTVSAPKPYSPSEYAIGHTAGNKAYVVTIMVENSGKEKFDAGLFLAEARAGKDGVTAEEIFDDSVGEGFTGTILPGKKATVKFAFDAPADAKVLTVEVTPGISHDATQWELKL